MSMQLPELLGYEDRTPSSAPVTTPSSAPARLQNARRPSATPQFIRRRRLSFDLHTWLGSVVPKLPDVAPKKKQRPQRNSVTGCSRLRRYRRQCEIHLPESPSSKQGPPHRMRNGTQRGFSKFRCKARNDDDDDIYVKLPLLPVLPESIEMHSAPTDVVLSQKKKTTKELDSEFESVYKNMVPDIMESMRAQERAWLAAQYLKSEKAKEENAERPVTLYVDAILMSPERPLLLSSEEADGAQRSSAEECWPDGKNDPRTVAPRPRKQSSSEHGRSKYFTN